MSFLIFCKRWLLGLTLSGLLSGSVFSSPAAAPEALKRQALVIGNARYEPAAGKLRNTENDAKAVAATLRQLGFAVVEKHNVTREQLLQLEDEFRRTLPGAEIALFYYAGHGLSIAGANYLIPLKSGFDPADAEPTTLRMLAETRLFNAEQIVADLSAAGAHCNLVILDACRNTPLARQSRTRGFGSQAGLVEMTPPAGSLIAFSTDAGRTAYDGDGANGLYTEELLKNMRAPGLTIEQVFKRTRAGVLARSAGGQVPAEYSRLIGDDVYLAGQAGAHSDLVEPAASAPEIRKPLPVVPPDPAALVKMASEGRAAECLQGLRLLLESRGSGDYTVPPLEALLERVKEDLQNATDPSTRVLAAVQTCEDVLRILPKCLPENHPQQADLAARAHNRRGDALLVLGKAREAVADFDAALSLAPSDAYILYNRGRAKTTLGEIEEARADFTAAASERFQQPKARRLALEALAQAPFK